MSSAHFLLAQQLEPMQWIAAVIVAVGIGISNAVAERAEAALEEEEIVRGAAGVESVMAWLGMTNRPEKEIPESRVYERSRWIRVPRRSGGFLFTDAGIGKAVEKGEALGNIVDPLTDESHTVVSSVDGEIIGMAFSRPVLSGYALYHVAWHTAD